MDFKKFFTERLGFGDKDIEIKVPNQEIPDLTEETEEDPSYAKATEGGEQDGRETRRRLFESKILRVLGMAAGLTVFSAPRQLEKYHPSLQTEQYKKEHSELSKKLGPQFDAFLLEMETYKAQKERTSEDIHTVVGDFEEADASSKDVQSYLEKGYPKEWLSKVRGVRMVPFELDVPAEYGLKDIGGKGTAKAIAYVEKRGELGGSSIVFSKEIKNFFSSASHELGHANDWQGRTDLPDEYRINLLYSVVKRVESPDRFKSAYVESINNKDEKKQLMNKAVEYWAEIVGEYLDHPKEAKTKLAPADLALVEQHLKVSATNFDPEQAVIAREARGRIIKQGIIEKQIKLAINESKIKHGDILFDLVREWAAMSRVTDTDFGIRDNEAEEDIILADIFSHGNKKWEKVDRAFMEAMEMVSNLSLLYRDTHQVAWIGRAAIDNDLEVYREAMKKVEKEMKKFSPAEQEKIKKFHQYLGNALREAEISPSDNMPEMFYK